ncbi:MAG: electron transfer flavoprotein subunit alpha/FixB family protein [Rhodothermales bacterium]|nr:electron transfer flavoprotein subunit alpha/FixB family protein [Rhodothermales bacterium]
MSQNVLVVASIQQDRVKRSTFEALARARSVARETDGVIEACVVHPDAASFAPELHRHGASVVHVISSDAVEPHVNAPVVAALERIIAETGPRIVVFPSTEAVKDVLGALAVRTGAAVLPDVSSFGVDGSEVVAERPVMAAKKIADTRTDADLVLVSVRSGSYEAEESPVDGSINEIDFSFDTSSLSQTLRDIVRPAGDTVDLSEARVVVAAGRGVRDEQGKRLVEELAGVFDAGIGASRAVVESGLFPASAQIGQTGKVVSPDLYFAVGISGAIQHVAGMSNSRVIVAINKDGDAPIFDIATYGLVGDLYDILPPLIEGLRNAV